MYVFDCGCEKLKKKKKKEYDTINLKAMEKKRFLSSQNELNLISKHEKLG